MENTRFEQKNFTLWQFLSYIINFIGPREAREARPVSQKWLVYVCFYPPPRLEGGVTQPPLPMYLTNDTHTRDFVWLKKSR